jgi:hypothetical protein
MRTPICFLLVVVFSTANAVAQNYRLDWLGISSGGETEQFSDNFGAKLTIAEAVAGSSESSDTRAYLGFWHVVGALSAHLCGDANNSGDIDIDDIIFVVNYVFTGGPEPDPYESADTNCSGFVDIDDIIFLVNYIFTAGPEPCDVNSDGVPDC